MAKLLYRVQAIEGPRLEATVSAIGTIKNIEITNTITYWNVHRPDGTMYGEGQGIMITQEGEIAASNAQGLGRSRSSGDIRWIDSIFYTVSSNGKLSFLNNLVRVFLKQMFTIMVKLQRKSGNGNKKKS